MCTPQCIAEKLGCLLADAALDAVLNAVLKQVQYVRRYRKNLVDLETEMRTLGERMESNRRKVDEANADGKEIEPAVSCWLTDAHKMKGDFDQLVEESTAKENMLCFARSCPNIKWRYRYSKQAEQKISDVKKLCENSHFDEISHPKPPPVERQSQFYYVNFDSRTSIFDDIVKALKDPNVNTIGVYGLGGVGKTTIVQEVGKKMIRDGTFKYAPLAIVPNNPNVKEIQSQLAASLNFKLDAAEESERANKLWHKFTNGEKYLVILDDIWKEVDLMTIGIPIANEKTGCKVLLTSRNQDLLQITMKLDTTFPIEELRFSEAWTLFKEKVGNSIESQPELYDLSQKVCKKCNGLPVAINALGAALKSKPVNAWKDALNKLERYMVTNISGISPSVWFSLKMSYDMLHSPDEQSCFLLCGLFAEDAEISIEDLTRHCVARSLLLSNPRTFDEATNAVSTIVGTLKSSSLLLNGSNEYVVKIHDVIRDVGISIALEEKAFLVDQGALQWPRNPIDKPPYSAISLRSLKIKRLPDVSTCPQLHTLILDNDKLSNLEIPDKFFSGMKNLTVLVLNRMRMQRLPSSLAKLSKLRMLYLNECELEDIAILGDLKTTLEVLSLRGSDITALPREIAQLTSLRVLDLQDCYYLMVIPQGVISNLTDLEELYFPVAFEEWEDTSNNSNVSLKELRSLFSIGQLTTLHITIPDVMLLPNESLKRFKIRVGPRPFYYDDPLEYEYSRAALEMCRITFRNELIPLVRKAEVLILQEIEALEKAVPLWSFNKLTVLQISKCKIKYLFSESTARGLIHLEQLEVGYCNSMEEIVRFEGQNDEHELISEVKFSKLKKLGLYDLPNLISFCAKKEKMEATKGSSSTRAQPLFNEKVICPVLKKLNIYELNNTVEIWDKQSALFNGNADSFTQLEYVSVDDCPKLMSLGPSNMLGRLQNLQELFVRKCPNIESIVYENGKEEEEAADDGTMVSIPQLRTLTIGNMENLKSFYSSSKRSNAQSLFNHQVICPVLKKLFIYGLDNVVEIWDKQSALFNGNADSFTQLEDVSVIYCAKLMNLLPSNILPWLQNLQELYVRNCPNIESIVYENGKEEEEAADDGTMVSIPQLRTLTIGNMENLKSFYSSSKRSNAQSLFNHQVICPVLKKLNIYGLNNTVEIWDKQSALFNGNADSFTQLEYVSVDDCPKLMSLGPSNMLGRLQNLQELYVRKCPNIESIVYENGKEEEEAADDGTMVSIPQLRTLTIGNMENLKSFYSSSKRSNAQSLFNHQVIFPVLKLLIVDGLGDIVEIWDKQSLLVHENSKSFSQLEYVTVKDCVKLMSLVPSNMLGRLQNLQNLFVFNCQNMESIVYENGKDKEKMSDDSTLVIIPQLRILTIVVMENLKSFYSSSKRSKAQSLFNHQVILPALGSLTVGNVHNITKIWDNKPLSKPEKETESFCELRWVDVCDCEQLVYVFPSYMLPQLHILQSLRIKNCKQLEVIVSTELKEKEVANNDVIVFPQLQDVTLEGLNKLTSFCSGKQVFFSNKDAFPVLEGIYLDENLEFFWEGTSTEKEAIEECSTSGKENDHNGEEG